MTGDHLCRLTALVCNAEDKPDLIVADAGACCDACLAESECNTWVFCGATEGCLGGETLYKQGLCTLKFQEAVETGSSAPTEFNRGIWVPWTSGTAGGTVVAAPAASMAAPADTQVSAAG